MRPRHWMILSKNGYRSEQLDVSGPMTERTAIQEAERLADLNRGHYFFVVAHEICVPKKGTL